MILKVWNEEIWPIPEAFRHNKCNWINLIASLIKKRMRYSIFSSWKWEHLTRSKESLCTRKIDKHIAWCYNIHVKMNLISLNIIIIMNSNLTSSCLMFALCREYGIHIYGYRKRVLCSIAFDNERVLHLLVLRMCLLLSLVNLVLLCSTVVDSVTYVKWHHIIQPVKCKGSTKRIVHEKDERPSNV